jgi:hypothetical protein
MTPKGKAVEEVIEIEDAAAEAGKAVAAAEVVEEIIEVLPEENPKAQPKAAATKAPIKPNAAAEKPPKATRAAKTPGESKKQLGRTTKMGVFDTWVYILEKNETRKPKMTDAKIREWIRAEFPAKQKSKWFGDVKRARRDYNNDFFCKHKLISTERKDEKPQPGAIKKGDKVEVLDGKNKGRKAIVVKVATASRKKVVVVSSKKAKAKTAKAKKGKRS